MITISGLQKKRKRGARNLSIPTPRVNINVVPSRTVKVPPAARVFGTLQKVMGGPTTTLAHK